MPREARSQPEDTNNWETFEDPRFLPRRWAKSRPDDIREWGNYPYFYAVPRRSTAATWPDFSVPRPHKRPPRLPPNPLLYDYRGYYHPPLEPLRTPEAMRRTVSDLYGRPMRYRFREYHEFPKEPYLDLDISHESLEELKRMSAAEDDASICSIPSHWDSESLDRWSEKPESLVADSLRVSPPSSNVGDHSLPFDMYVQDPYLGPRREWFAEIVQSPDLILPPPGPGRGLGELSLNSVSAHTLRRRILPVIHPLHRPSPEPDVVISAAFELWTVGLIVAAGILVLCVTYIVLVFNGNSDALTIWLRHASSEGNRSALRGAAVPTIKGSYGTVLLSPNCHEGTLPGWLFDGQDPKFRSGSDGASYRAVLSLDGKSIVSTPNSIGMDDFVLSQILSGLIINRTEYYGPKAFCARFLRHPSRFECDREGEELWEGLCKARHVPRPIVDEPLFPQVPMGLRSRPVREVLCPALAQFVEGKVRATIRVGRFCLFLLQKQLGESQRQGGAIDSVAADLLPALTSFEGVWSLAEVVAADLELRWSEARQQFEVIRSGTQTRSAYEPLVDTERGSTLLARLERLLPTDDPPDGGIRHRGGLRLCQKSGLCFVLDLLAVNDSPECTFGDGCHQGSETRKQHTRENHLVCKPGYKLGADGFCERSYAPRQAWCADGYLLVDSGRDVALSALAGWDIGLIESEASRFKAGGVPECVRVDVVSADVTFESGEVPDAAPLREQPLDFLSEKNTAASPQCQDFGLNNAYAESSEGYLLMPPISLVFPVSLAENELIANLYSDRIHCLSGSDGVVDHTKPRGTVILLGRRGRADRRFLEAHVPTPLDVTYLSIDFAPNQTPNTWGQPQQQRETTRPQVQEPPPGALVLRSEELLPTWLSDLRSLFGSDSVNYSAWQLSKNLEQGYRERTRHRSSNFVQATGSYGPSLDTLDLDRGFQEEVASILQMMASFND